MCDKACVHNVETVCVRVCVCLCVCVECVTSPSSGPLQGRAGVLWRQTETSPHPSLCAAHHQRGRGCHTPGSAANKKTNKAIKNLRRPTPMHANTLAPLPPSSFPSLLHLSLSVSLRLYLYLYLFLSVSPSLFNPFCFCEASSVGCFIQC